MKTVTPTVLRKAFPHSPLANWFRHPLNDWYRLKPSSKTSAVGYKMASSSTCSKSVWETPGCHVWHFSFNTGSSWSNWWSNKEPSYKKSKYLPYCIKGLVDYNFQAMDLYLTARPSLFLCIEITWFLLSNWVHLRQMFCSEITFTCK